MNIIFASDDNGVEMLCVAAFSLIKNNRGSKLSFHIINAGLSEVSQQRIKRLAINDAVNISFYQVEDSYFNTITPANHKVPRAAYYRYLAPELLHDQDRALYLDIDMLCVGSINDLYNTPLGENYVAGVEDEFALLPDVRGFKKAIGLKATDGYVNSGCILMNLEKIRADNVMDIFWENIRNRDKLIPKKYNKYNDQTVFNITFKGHIQYLDSRYNTLSILLNHKTVDDDFTILHFAGVDKPITQNGAHIPSVNSEYYHLYSYYYEKCIKLIGHSDRRLTSPVAQRSEQSDIDKLDGIVKKHSTGTPEARMGKLLTINDVAGSMDLLRYTTQTLLTQKIVFSKRTVLTRGIQDSFLRGEDGLVDKLKYNTIRIVTLRGFLKVTSVVFALFFRVGYFLQKRGVKV